MPRSRSKSSSPRRHNPTPTLSNHVQPTSRVSQILSSDPFPASGDPSDTPSALSRSRIDAVDDLLSPSRVSGPSRRRIARVTPSPYGQRPLQRWIPSEQKHMGVLVNTFSEQDSDENEEIAKEQLEPVSERGPMTNKEMGLKVQVAVRRDQHEHEDAHQRDFQPTPGEAGISRAPPLSERLPSAAMAKKREKNKKKKARARAKARENNLSSSAVQLSPPTVVCNSMPAPPPQELLASISHIGRLVNLINHGVREDSFSEALQRIRVAISEIGTSQPAQSSPEVLQSVRRIESMLRQMNRYQMHVSPCEIEALQQETARLEDQACAAVEDSTPTEMATDSNREGKGVSIHLEEVAMERAGQIGGHSSQTGAKGQDEHDSASASDQDSVPESTFSQAESGTGPTEADTEASSVWDDKTAQAVRSSQAPATLSSPAFSPAPTISAFPSPRGCLPPKSSISGPQPVHDASVVPGVHSAGTSTTTLASRNHNIPPEPPHNPVEYLTKNPWTMLEALFLLEIVAHFPPTENGWTFVAEAYNNILITRPLQEWFGKQATSSNGEDAKMRALLQTMAVEARQLRATHKMMNTTDTKAGEHGKTVPSGSAKAHAEACAQSSVTQAKGPSSAVPPHPMASDNDLPFVVRLPYPLEGQRSWDNQPAALQLQCIIPFPRRRPPLTLPSADAGAFARVMKSAATGVRPPSAESRAAMLSLYTATRSRFPVRSPWDCWHRWSTPWVVQDPRESGSDASSMVLDYVTGNIAVPCGTWVTQPHRFEYHTIPGTYPAVPGVQHTVNVAYDPRPGMVSFARMTHLTAEKAWMDIGLGRREDGFVTEEVLAGRRMKLPATLAGIWPGKARPMKSAGARGPAPAVPTPSHRMSSSKSAKTSAPATKAAEFVPHNKIVESSTKPVGAPASAKLSKVPVAAPSPTPISAPEQARPPVPVSTSSISRPASPFLPLPQPRKQLVRNAPLVPEGTLGHPTRPGIRAWFDCALVCTDILEHVSGLQRAREPFERSLRPSLWQKDYSEGSDGWEREKEKNGLVPLHLRKLIIPPPLRPSSQQLSAKAI